MSNLTLAVAAAAQLAVAVAFAFVAERLRARATHAGPRGPAIAFVVWWWGLGIYLAMQGLLLAGAVAGWTPLWAHVAARLVAGPLLCAAVAGLAYHILFILTGRAWVIWPLAVYYTAAAIAYDALTLAGNPTSVLAGDWQVDLAPTPPASLAWQAVLASIGLPVILSSVAFLLLVPTLADRVQKYRAALVGSSILAWVGSGLLAQLSGNDAQKFVTLVLFGLAAAILVLLAYFPNRRIRAWLDAPRAGSSD